MIVINQSQGAFMSKLDQLTKELHELERQLMKADRERKQLLEKKAQLKAAIAKEKSKAA